MLRYDQKDGFTPAAPHEEKLIPDEADFDLTLVTLALEALKQTTIRDLLEEMNQRDERRFHAEHGHAGDTFCESCDPVATERWRKARNARREKVAAAQKTGTKPDTMEEP